MCLLLLGSWNDLKHELCCTNKLVVLLVAQINLDVSVHNWLLLLWTPLTFFFFFFTKAEVCFLHINNNFASIICIFWNHLWMLSAELLSWFPSCFCWFFLSVCLFFGVYRVQVCRNMWLKNPLKHRGNSIIVRACFAAKSNKNVVLLYNLHSPFLLISKLHFTLKTKMHQLHYF